MLTNKETDHLFPLVLGQASEGSTGMQIQTAIALLKILESTKIHEVSIDGVRGIHCFTRNLRRELERDGFVIER
jgi:hypothetical protein